MTVGITDAAGLPDETELLELPDGRRVHGVVDEGYGRVMEVFVENFLARRDLGAACTVYVGGRTVVDVWGGVADARNGRPWDRDTSAVTFSCSKGVLAICGYLLVQEGRLDLDAPIARSWPAFGRHGKGAVTVREAMSHRAGLPALDRDLTKDEVIAWDPVIRAIEDQEPLFEPAAGHLYHALTYGWLVGEVIRRLTGLTPGRYFRAAIGDRLGFPTWIGIPDAERASVAWMEPPLADEDSEQARESARIVRDDPVVARSVSMGGAFAFPADDGFVTFNDPEIQAGEIPGANGISTPRRWRASMRPVCRTSTGRRCSRPRRSTTRSGSGPPARSSRACRTTGRAGGRASNSRRHRPSRCSDPAASATAEPVASWRSPTPPTAWGLPTSATKWVATATLELAS